VNDRGVEIQMKSRRIARLIFTEDGAAAGTSAILSKDRMRMNHFSGRLQAITYIYIPPAAMVPTIQNDRTIHIISLRHC
jgi:hypothetical protein